MTGHPGSAQTRIRQPFIRFGRLTTCYRLDTSPRMDNGEEPASPSLRKAEELLEQARTLLAEARDSGEVTEQGKGILTAVMFLLQSHVDLVVNVEIREDNPEPDFTD
jgi:hypothetical protein